MIVLNIKLLSWIIATLLLIGFNVFFNKSEGQYDLSPLFKGGLSLLLYAVFWIVWLIFT